MKKLSLVILTIAALFAVFSCEDPEAGPVLQMDQVVAPSFASPSGSPSFVLSKDEVDDILTTFSWNPTDYGFAAGTQYTLEVTFADSSYSNAMEIVTTNDTFATITVGAMNELMLNMSATPDEENSLKMRLVSVISEFVDEVMSGDMMITVTPYSDEAPPLYMLGDATRAGWNNAEPLQLVSLGEGKYHIIDTLYGGNYYKFITTPGAWAPQYGTDGSATPESGNLVLRATESEPDPPALQAPAESGIYEVIVDIINLTYEVKPAGLFMLGDGTAAGWNNAEPLAMGAKAPFVFTLTTDLLAGNIKFIRTPGAWAPQYGTDASGTSTSGTLVPRPTDADPDPSSIPSPGAGTYTVEADLINLTYTITPASK